MKRNLWLLVSLILLFVACDKNEEVTTSPSGTFTATGSNRFFGVKRFDSGTTKGIAQQANLWYPGSTIKVKFLNDPYNMKDKVKVYAKEWEKHAGINFNFIDSGDAQVRIDFDRNDDRFITWSCIGTDCKRVNNQNEATMSFAYFNDLSENDIRAEVLRTFGMVLGLELEHRHLEFDPGWTSRISQYWTGEIADIPWDDLAKYVFNPLDASDIIQTKEYDEHSIMIWPFLSRYALNTARDFNYDLSDKDIEFIKQLYPKKNNPTPTMPTEGIVAYYPFGGNANDHSANNLNGVIYGATLAADRKGTANAAYYFDGVKDYISIQNFGKYVPAEEVTVSIWVKSVKLARQFQLMLCPDDSRFALSVNYLQYNSNHSCWEYGLDTSTSSLAGGGLFFLDTLDPSWHHYVFTSSVSDGKMKIYKDNVLVAENSTARKLITNDSKELLIGTSKYLGKQLSNYYNGYIDDIVIYNRVLSNSEINILYNL